MLKYILEAWGNIFAIIIFIVALVAAILCGLCVILIWVSHILEDLMGSRESLNAPPYIIWAYFGAIVAVPTMVYVMRWIWNLGSALAFYEDVRDTHPIALGYVLFFAIPALLGWTLVGYLAGLFLSITAGPMLSYWLKEKD